MAHSTWADRINPNNFCPSKCLYFDLIINILLYKDMFGMDSRIFLVQRFIIMLIVIRVFTTHLFPLEVFVGVILSLFVVQYYKEGLTPLTLLILPVLALSVYG